VIPEVATVNGSICRPYQLLKYQNIVYYQQNIQNLWIDSTSAEITAPRYNTLAVAPCQVPVREPFRSLTF
jgi:hypothetical protein